MREPRPIRELSAPACRALRGVLTDIDDTLTTDGRLTAAAYAALERASEAGLLTVVVTGRPAGWADHIARMWPVDGVVAENGALYMRHTEGKMRRRYVLEDAQARQDNQRRLRAIVEEILAAVPGTAWASDQAFREFDVAVDFCEDVAPLSGADVDRILAIFQEHGATTRLSSIHVNAWFGDYDKLGMLKTLLLEQHGADVDDDAIAQQFVYLGDSPNDEPMFEFFPLSIGVANIADFRDRLTHPPAFVTRQRSGAGFAEAIDHILAQR